MLHYIITLKPAPETGAVVAGFPDIEFCHSDGDDADETLLNAKDALISALEIFIEQRQPVPSMVGEGQPSVLLPGLIAQKVLFLNDMQAQGVRKAALARRLRV